MEVRKVIAILKQNNYYLLKINLYIIILNDMIKIML